MPVCPHCLAELDLETLSAAESISCPHCDKMIDPQSQDWDLSSLPGGSPADATMRVGEGSDSSLGGSSFAASDDAESNEASDSPSDPSSADSAIENTLDASPRIDGGGDTPPPDAGGDEEPDMTMVFGGKYADEDDDSFDLMLEESDEADDDAQPMDATIDYSAFDQQREERDATIDLTGQRAPEPPPAVEAEEVDDDLTPPDLTQMIGGAARAQEDLQDDVTLPADSDRADSDQPGSSAGGSSFGDSDWPDESDRPGSDPGQTESPSTHAEDVSDDRNSATLAFDTHRRSDRVETPDPIDITGLSSGRTIPRGPLEEGRGSDSLKPGHSQVVGSESVRLRAFRIGDETAALRYDGDGLDYEIEGEAGKGGMGVVYKARQQSMDRLVALKQIKSDLSSSESDRNKFISEAVITGQLEHPNIAPVHDLGLAADGLPFYAMKFVEGEDWEDSIKRMSEEENLAILIQVAQAIAFAHSKQVLHRDLKPGNVRLGSFGEVLVMDWGLAARLDDGSHIQPAGTPIYMPPETALEYLDYAKGRVSGGKGVSSSRKRSPAGTYGDVYLLGALLFKIVTGRAPHRGKTTFECLRNAAKNEIIKVRRSSELLDIAYKAMATDPEDRYATATDFIDAIKAYQAHAQSILIAKRASQELRAAEKLRQDADADANATYASFSRAQHGYQNALDLWGGNRKAARRLTKTKRLFAEAAHANGDYDLALSMLDERSEEDAELRASVLTDQKSRNARLAWFKTLQYATAVSLVLALCFIGLSFSLGNDLLTARAELEKTEADAKLALAEAEEASAVAAQEKAAADQSRQEAKLALAEAEQAADEKADAEAERDEANRAKTEAVELAAAARAALADATRQEEKARVAAAEAAEVAKTEQSRAAFGEVKNALFSKGPYAASKRVAAIPVAVREAIDADPAWMSLLAATDLSGEVEELISEEAAATGTALAGSAGGFAVVAKPNAIGGTTVLVYEADAAQPRAPIQVEGDVRQVAIDRTGRYLAAAGTSLWVYDTTSGERLRLDGPDAASASGAIAFTPAIDSAKPELLAAGPGTGVQRWEIDGDVARLVESEDQWHREEVTAVGYSPDGRQRFSADGEGRVVLWRQRDGGWLDRATFDHNEALGDSAGVTAVAMTDEPRGRLAYGCDDGSVYEFAGWWRDPSERRFDPKQPAKQLSTGFVDVTPERLRTAHPKAVNAVAYAEQGATVLSCGGDTLLVRRAPGRSEQERSFESQRKQERRYHDAEVTACVAGTNGFAYSCDEKGRVLRWKLDVDPDALTVEPATGTGAGVAAIRLHRGEDGAVSVDVADRDGYLRHWDDIDRPARLSVSYAGHADHRNLRVWSLPGETPRLVTVAGDGRACVWNERGGLLERVIDLGGRTTVAVDVASETLFATTDGQRPNDDNAAGMAYPLRGGQPTPLWQAAVRATRLTPLGADSVAVGLRDGQVFVWRSRDGRIDLVRSTARPHWSPVRAMSYDTQTDALYTGDELGLVVKWSLSDGKPVATRRLRAEKATPIVSLTALTKGRLVAVKRLAGGLQAELLDSSLEPIVTPNLAADGLTTLAVDATSGRLVGLRETDGRLTLAVWSDGDGWREPQTAAPIDEALSGAAFGADRLFTWGRRTVSAWSAEDERLRLASRVVSRPPTQTLLGAADTLSAVTMIGSIDRWSAGRRDLRQGFLGVDAPVVASVVGPNDGEAVVALSRGDSTAIEVWSVANRQLRLTIARELPGRCRALALASDRVVATFGDRVVIASLDGDRTESFALPPGDGRPRSVAVTPEGDRVVVVKDRGFAWHASRTARDWQVTPLDRDDLSAAAFTPEGLLAVGVTSGRVLLLELDATEPDRTTTRPRLTFTGHSAPVTRLQHTSLDDAPTLVSGDAAGRVVVRSL